MKCTRCKAHAVVALPSHNAAFCPECFLDFFSKQVDKGIREHNLMTRQDKVLVALSGGKDSLALMLELGRQGYKEGGDADAEHQHHPQGRQGDLIGVLPALLPLAAGDQGGDGHIDPDKQGQPDKLRLGGEPDRGHRIAAQGCDHHGVNDPGQGHKKAFDHRGPGDGDRFQGHLLPGHSGGIRF